MNLFIHDIACAIERDATRGMASLDRSSGPRDSWLEEWRHRLSLELDEDADGGPDRDER